MCRMMATSRRRRSEDPTNDIVHLNVVYQALGMLKHRDRGSSTAAASLTSALIRCNSCLEQMDTLSTSFQH